MGQMLAKFNDRRGQMNLVDVCRLLQAGRFNKIVAMTGPGINATPEMIDQRFNGEGVYGLIETAYDITYSSNLLSSDQYAHNPASFFVCLAEIFKLRVKLAEVGLAQKLLQLLHERKQLLRVYTTNVDSGERRAGLPASKVVEVYGHLRTSHCLKCNKVYSYRWLRHFMHDGNFDPNNGSVSLPRCIKCKGFIKPDVVLFGDAMNEKFTRLREKDMAE